MTIEAIAAMAGVSKPTIYRSWKNSYAVAMEAFLESANSSRAFWRIGQRAGRSAYTVTKSR